MTPEIKPQRFTFQLVIDSQNIFLSMSPDKKKMRANITTIEPDQLEKIVDAVIDAGPQAVELFKKIVAEKLKQAF